jgi:hypothetical protein
MASSRKKPGRPKKRADVCPVGMRGIVSEPNDTGDCIEFIYNQPMIFKCIMSIFKEYDCDEVIFDFTAKQMQLIGRDRPNTVVIRIMFNSNDMNLYYFSQNSANAIQADDNAPQALVNNRINYDDDDDDDVSESTTDFIINASREINRDVSATIGSPATDIIARPIRIAIKRDNLELVASNIDKSHYKMTMLLKNDDPSCLIIVLNSNEYDHEDRFEVTIIPRATDIPFELPNLEKFPLKFTIDSHHLRRKISEFKKISENIIIQKKGSANLEISFGSSQRVLSTTIYKNDTKIRLSSSIADDDLFISTISLERIRPLMAVNIPGGITFFTNKVDPTVVQIGLDIRCGETSVVADNAPGAIPQIGTHPAIVAQLLIRTKPILT